MAQRSSLPPLKMRNSRYGVIALLLLLAAFVLWFLLRMDDRRAVTEPMEVGPEPPKREQFAPEIEIPGQDAGPSPARTAKRRSRSPSRENECFGTLEATQIRSVINGQPRRQVRACYERRLKDDNLLQGSMAVLLTIDETGAVSAVSVKGSLRDRQVYDCVKRVARTWKFPTPKGGCVRTEVPFQMTPKL